MKPGDIIWVFSGETIEYFVFDGYDIRGYVCGHIDEHTKILIAEPEKTPLFPTREALCEHYRKIFE